MPVLASLLAIASVTSSSPEWEEALKLTFRDSTFVAIDINRTLQPKTFAAGETTLDWKPLFAAQINRKFEVIDGVNVFHRNGGIEGSDHLDDKGYWLTKWLVERTPDQLRRLNTDSLTIGDMPEGEKSEFLSRFLMDDKQTEILLRKGDNVNVRVRMIAAFNYVDPKSGLTKTQTFPIPEDPISPPEVPDAKPKVTRVPEDPIRPGAFPLEFPTGKVIEVKDLMGKAETAFKTQYDYDGRFSDETIFVKGGFSRTTFESVMSRILKGRVFKAGDRRLNDSERLLLGSLATIENAGSNLKLAGYPGDADDVRQGKEVPIAELVQKSPWFAKYAKKMGLGADQTVRVRPGIAFFLEPGGETLMSTSKATNGETIRIMRKNGIVLTVP